MPRSGPRQIYKYSKDVKLAAVRLSRVPGMQLKAVATALGIHPFMLSKWRKDVRDGTLRGRLPKAAPAGPTCEIARLQQHERGIDRCAMTRLVGFGRSRMLPLCSRRQCWIA